MDRLYELCKSLDKEDQVLFQKFLIHKFNRENRKDLNLFRSILNDKISDSNYNTSERLIRLRIKRSLEEFISLKINKNDIALNINKLFGIAKYLFIKKNYSMGWIYLIEAEKTSIRNEEFEILNQIYNYMLEFTWTNDSLNLDELIQKSKFNMEKVHENLVFNFALSQLRKQLDDANAKGIKINIKETVDTIFRNYEINLNISDNVSKNLKIASLVHLTLESQKEYDNLCNYSVQIFEDLEKGNSFNENNLDEKINLLSRICYTAMYSGKYDVCEKYSEISILEINKNPKYFIWGIRTLVSKVALLAMTGRVEDALDFAYDLQKNNKKHFLEDDYFNYITLVNLACLNLELGKISEGQKAINTLINSPNRIAKSIGFEGLINVYFTQCIFAFELKEMDLLNYRLKALKRKFNTFMNQEEMLRYKIFFQLLKKLSDDPDIISSPAYQHEVYKFLNLAPIYHPGLEFISLNAWITSKVYKIKFDESEYNQWARENLI